MKLECSRKETRIICSKTNILCKIVVTGMSDYNKWLSRSESKHMFIAKYLFNAENKNSTHSWKEMITETNLSVTFLNSANSVPTAQWVMTRLRQGQWDGAEVKTPEGQSTSVLEVTILPVPQLPQPCSEEAHERHKLQWCSTFSSALASEPTIIMTIPYTVEIW